MSGVRARVVALVGAFDTKGAEYVFVRDCIHARGCETFAIDIGVLGTPAFRPDVSSSEIAQAGGSPLSILIERRDRGEAMAAMSRGAAALVPLLFAEGKFDAVIALGGGGGTAVACAAMRALPLGIPKVMVSTLASGDVSNLIGVKDIVMIPSIVDIAGLNRISRGVLARAAGAVCGMAETVVAAAPDKPIIAASMFGNTTIAVNQARAILEGAGFEVIVFHATGSGGRAMESLIESGAVAGVLDITTTEWADELCGGVLSAGPSRLEAAAKAGVPAVVAPGCLDMVNFRRPESVPQAYAGRTFYAHNPEVTLMRTNVAENRRLGEIIAAKLNASTGPVSVVFPRGGVSMLDAPGGAFWWPEADGALFESLTKALRSDIPVSALDCNINDPLFATTCANTLLSLLKVEASEPAGA